MKMDPAALASWQAITHETGDLAQNRAHSSFCTLVSIHDLRHFRATQWVQRGVDLRTVQELLGHSAIATTMTYAHFAPSHASRSILEAQRSEQQEIAGDK